MIGGNLSNYIDVWKEITANETVLNWISDGVPLDLITEPGKFEETNNVFSPQQTLFLDQEIPRLVNNGCIKQCATKPYCVSRIATVPKQDGSYRLITDLRQLNTCLTSKSFIYENIDTVLEIVEPSDKLITLDIKNGFFHIKVDPRFQTYLGFAYKNQYYVWCVLPFGLKHSPYYWGKILRPVVQHLRQNGLKTVAYVDDFILTDKEDRIEHCKDFLIQTLNSLGYAINYAKSDLLPSCSVKYIGYVVITDKDKDSVWLHIPKERLKRVQADIKRALKKKRIVARGLARIAGQIISMCKVLLPAKLLLRNVYRLLASKSSWQDKLTIDKATATDLEWWLSALKGWNGRAFKRKAQNVMQITTDASGSLGWGGTVVGTEDKAQGYWDWQTAALSSNAKELLAVLLTLKSFLHLVKNKTVQILSDSVTTCAFVNFQGGSIKTLDIIARNIWDLAIRNCITIQAKHLAARLNTEADRLSRLSGQYEWYIHPCLFQYIDNLYGPHTIDRFGSILTHQLPRYNSLFWDPGTEGVDALYQTNWESEVNFVNPPFRLLPKVVDIIQNTQCEATVIAPYWPAKPWFYKLKQMAVHPPLKLPKPRQMCIPCLKTVPEPVKNSRWNLYAWRVSGKNV